MVSVCVHTRLSVVVGVGGVCGVNAKEGGSGACARAFVRLCRFLFSPAGTLEHLACPWEIFNLQNHENCRTTLSAKSHHRKKCKKKKIAIMVCSSCDLVCYLRPCLLERLQ